MEDKLEKVRKLLSDIYCNNCKHGGNKEALDSNCDWCIRKSIGWEPSDNLLEDIVEDTLK